MQTEIVCVRSLPNQSNLFYLNAQGFDGIHFEFEQQCRDALKYWAYLAPLREIPDLRTQNKT